MRDIIMKGVREYGEEMEVTLGVYNGRMIILALNEAGCCSTEVDLEDVIDWLRANKPELLEERNWRSTIEERLDKLEKPGK